MWGKGDLGWGQGALAPPPALHSCQKVKVELQDSLLALVQCYTIQYLFCRQNLGIV